VTTLVGLDLAGRRVVVAGAGNVGTRRARGLAGEGAHVLLIDPTPSDAARDLAAEVAASGRGRVDLAERAVQAADLEDAWLVVAATGLAGVDADLLRWSEERRVWCIRGAEGSARTVASSRHEGLVVGVVSDGEPDPRRSAGVRDALAAYLASGQADLRRRRAPGSGGRVVLVGAGPGDPGLLTLAGLEALAAADVVVHDRLGARQLVDRLPPGVELVDVGKTATHHRVPQAQVNRLLVEHARAGRTVVRLKGGDPYLFGRGGEEAHACRAAGVEVEVVPGVSSGLAVPALAGIPVTQRGVSTSLLVSSGHAGAEPAAVAALAAGATLVLLMAVGALAEICAAALAAGVEAATPVAVVESGSTAQQRVTHATLATAGEVARAAGVRSPAVVVVGRVAAEGFLDDPVCATEAFDA
jgi:uroporphyrin-III C-methyltransferase / precorrin-2 dehydrogenase / sirohydrochlorin ferrochelatase